MKKFLEKKLQLVVVLKEQYLEIFTKKYKKLELSPKQQLSMNGFMIFQKKLILLLVCIWKQLGHYRKYPP